MTIITYGSSVKETAKTRRHARRRAAAIERDKLENIIDVAFGIETVAAAPIAVRRISRIEKAVNVSSYPRQLAKALAYHEPLAMKREEKQRREHEKISNEAGRQIHAVQKVRGKSIPLI